MIGGPSRDRLVAGAGDDDMQGGHGADVIDGGSGRGHACCTDSALGSVRLSVSLGGAADDDHLPLGGTSDEVSCGEPPRIVVAMRGDVHIALAGPSGDGADTDARARVVDVALRIPQSRFALRLGGC